MFSRDLCQGCRRSNHKGKRDKRPCVQVEDRTHIGISLPQLVGQIVRVDVFGKFGHDRSEDDYVANYGMMRWHCLIGSKTLDQDSRYSLTQPCFFNQMALLRS